MKATGRGITLGLGKFVVRVDPSLPAELLSVVEGSAHHWWLQDVDPGPAMAGALADATGTFDVSFAVIALLGIIAIFGTLGLPKRAKR